MYTKIIMPLLLILVVAGSCKKDVIPPIGEPASKLAGINATWRLTKVEQFDEKVAGDSKTFDITSFFTTGAAPTIQFDSAAKTFQYNAGTAPNFLGVSGLWRFDDDNYPTVILVKESTAGRERSWVLGGPTRPVDTQLKLRISRNACAADASYAYLFTFTRQ
jgi:Domain of unknown function (DUF5004)